MRTDDITIIVISLEAITDDQSPDTATAPITATQVRPAVFMEAKGGPEDGRASGLAREEPEPIRSTQEIQALDGAMRSNFLFANLTDDQRVNLYNRMQRVVFYPGDIVIRQGDKGDNFYVVKEGILDVYIAQGEENSTLVHTYKPADGFHPSFGELALMYGQPRAATVVARTRSVLWSLDREGFRSVVQRHSPKWLIQLLQGVDCLRPLKLSQLELMVNLMEELAFQDGEVIVRQGDEGDSFYIITHGEVVVTIQRSEDEDPKQVLALGLHQYFGEKALTSSARRAASVIARGFVRLLYITRATFERMVGDLNELERERQDWEAACQALAERRKAAPAGPLPRDAEELTPTGTLAMTPAAALIRCQVGDNPAGFTARVTSVTDVSALNMVEQVLRARGVTRELDASYPSSLVPQVLRVFKDERMIVEVLGCDPLCTVSQLMRPGGFSEDAARYIAASVTVALDHLHRAHTVFRSLSLDSVVLTRTGQVQLVDFRFAKSMEGHTYSMTGISEFVAPEMIEQKASGGLALS